MKTFNNLEEMQPYYVKENNTYVFDESIELTFDLTVKSDINARDINARNITARDITAWNITAWDITAWNITAWDITAWDINAWNINYYAVCFAYKNISCVSIKGDRENSKHFVLDGQLIIKEEQE